MITSKDKKAIFLMAHKMAKKVHVKGESYMVTFGQAIRNIYTTMRTIQAKVAKLVADGYNKIECRQTAKGNSMLLVNDNLGRHCDLTEIFDMYGKQSKKLMVNVAINAII